MKWLKKNGITLLLVLVFLTGAGLLLYPAVSDAWISGQQAEQITFYVKNTTDEEAGNFESLLAEAAAYNEELSRTGIRWGMSETEKEAYNACLRLDDTEVMSYIEIPAIDCTLPVYHGTEEAVLQVGVGHIEGSSLPVGGESSHCILSGHTGLASARLFTDLDQLQEGDIFRLCTLGMTLTYQVDRICVVEPTDLSQLQLEEGKDYCTLVTCTPYGINTHRLLVRGHRIENEKTGFEEAEAWRKAGLP